MTKVLIQIYGEEDLKKNGEFKKKNNIKEMSKEDFFKYLKDNKLNINYGYIDYYGNITNGKNFKCFFNNLIIGTSSICKEFQEGLK